MSKNPKFDLGGVVVATTLPFKEDPSAPAGLAVDYDKFAEHVDFLMNNGCRGVGPNGSLGEYEALTDEERRKVIQVAVKAVNGRGIVIAGVHGTGWHSAKKWAEYAKEDGAPVTVPFVEDRLAEIPEVVAIKEFSGDIRRILAIKELCDIDVICGTDDLLFESLVVGAEGWFAGYPNAFPKEAVAIYDLVKAGDIAGAFDSVGTPRSSSCRPSNSRWTSPVRPTAARPVRRVARSRQSSARR